ncbi:MAG: GHMP kinase [Parcubacteria group bacterium Gr01-1014_31]|nr:MAG: GHMP kinase [Parcubacteria group bacterium Gr01-1014_31]
MKIFASAPTRIDLAGGTLDLEPLYLFHPGASSVNLAITLPATVALTPRSGRSVVVAAHDRGQTLRAASAKALPAGKLPLLTAAIAHFAPTSGFTLETDCAAPAGSGLGGSSSLIVALVAAFQKWQKLSPPFPSPLGGEGRVRGNLDKEKILKIAKGIETAVIKVPTGFQDYLPALYGGLNVWHFGTDGMRREALRLRSGFLKTLERQLVLAFTGVPHFSGTNNWEIFKRHVDGNARVRRLFDRLRDNAAAMAAALRAQNLAQVARVLNRDWQVRRQLAPGVSTPTIDRLVREGKRIGVLGSRVCGAGGGGCVAFLARPGRIAAVRAWLLDQQVVVLRYKIDHRGLRVKVTP